MTADVDATLALGDLPLEQVFEVLGRHAIQPRMDGAMGFARERQMLLVRHAPSGVPLDLSLAWLPFERDAIRRGERCDYAGVVVPVARPDDLVIYKLVAARPRDLDDAERLLLLHGPRLDLRRIVDTVREFAAALEDPGRVDTLQRLLRRGHSRPDAAGRLVLAPPRHYRMPRSSRNVSIARRHSSGFWICSMWPVPGIRS